MTADTCACDAQPSDDDRQCPACGASVTGRQTMAPKGTCLALYPIGATLTGDQRHALATARPAFVMPHAGPSGIRGFAARIAAEVRALLPGVSILVGVGCDGWTLDAINGRCTTEQAIDALVSCAETAAAIGAIGVVYDPEGASEGHPVGMIRHPAASAVALGTLAAVRSRFPHLVVGHTSYDIPVAVQWTDAHGHTHRFGGHGDYPWREWLASENAATLDVPQVYFGAQTGIAMVGSGPWRLARHMDSWNQASAKGWITPGADHAVYVQAHGATVRDTCAVADAFTFRCFWGAGERGVLDGYGLCSLSVMCELDRLGGYTIREAQSARGLIPDGVVGPKTCAALGVAWPG